MKKIAAGALIFLGLLSFGTLSEGHFAMIIPSKDVIGKDDPKDIGLFLQFTHPFEGGPQMDMAKPVKFGVVMGDSVTNLGDTLKEKKIDGKSTWETTFRIDKPGDYVFFLHPQPYWEPAEDKFIVHLTKVIVDALGAEEGWDKPIGERAGIEAEIVPLARPYSLYAGNLFSGQVLRNGKPVPGVDVEVEWWGKGTMKAPTDAHTAQVVKSDPNGVFYFAMPRDGWWGFSAVMEADKPINHEGKDRKVELAAVIWVYAYPMK